MSVLFTITLLIVIYVPLFWPSSLLPSFASSFSILSSSHPPFLFAGTADQSISPYCPTTPSRFPHVVRAARVTERDVVYDLGCGDGSARSVGWGSILYHGQKFYL